MTFFRSVKTLATYRLIPEQAEEATKVNRFLDALEIRGLSPCTIRSYCFDLALLLNWMNSSRLALADLNEAMLLGFVELQQILRAAPRSINRRLATCRAFYRFCFAQGIPIAPGTTLPSPYYRGPGIDRNLGLFRLRRRERLALRVRVPQCLIDPLRPEEVNRFVERFLRYRDLAIIHLMLLCGLRSREVLLLRLGDLNLPEGQILVNGKGGKQRMLPLHMTLADMLRRYLALERPSSGTNCDSCFLILQGRRRGQPMTTDGIRSLFRYRRKLLNLRKANPHRFRHTFGTDMARAGVSLPVLQRILGHSDPGMTLHYINLSVADLSAEYERAMKIISMRYGQ